MSVTGDSLADPRLYMRLRFSLLFNTSVPVATRKSSLEDRYW